LGLPQVLIVRKVFGNLLLTAGAVLFALLLFEPISRVILEPVDFLRPQLVDDPVLGHIISPGSGGHDGWGFRNRMVPGHANIVAIGDSQTYGVSTPAKYSWPAVLQKISHLSVYNLSLGGYSTPQYFHLLTTKAVILKPKVVVVGFYLGNDLLETYEVIQNRPYWSQYSRPGFSLSEPRPGTPPEPAAATAAPFLNETRSWFAQHSVVYNLLIHSALGELARVIEARFVAMKAEDDGSVIYAKDGIRTGFTPEQRLKALDVKDPRVTEGLLLSVKLIAKMNAYCLERGIHMLVLLIPTKESVYARFLEKDPAVREIGAMQSLWANERTVNRLIKGDLAERRIAYLDLLPEMEAQVARVTLYPGNYDGHPNMNGYRVIAETVANYLKPRKLKTKIPA
jgi:lysophospholipase L1-like esterase